MEYLERRVSMVDDRLEAVIDAVDPPELSDELAHVALAGGKRVRPAVTILSCEACGGDPDAAVDFAVAIELVHNASLVIDDIIDRSDVRRGTPSAWAQYGYGPAIIASDGLLGEAFALLSVDDQAMQIVAESMVELGEGEATELVARPTNEAEYMELARRKTGALFRAAAELGAVAADADPFTVEAFGEYAERVGVAFQIRDDVLDATADADPFTVEAFGEYAERVGVAFQIRDDVLDATADADELGKPTGQDEQMDRPSVVQVTDLTPAEANRRARDQSDQALDALDTAKLSETDSLGYLRDLAEFVVVRER